MYLFLDKRVIGSKIGSPEPSSCFWCVSLKKNAELLMKGFSGYMTVERSFTLPRNVLLVFPAYRVMQHAD